MRNRRQAWDIESIQSRLGKSLSDDGLYNEICNLAVKDDQVFRKFRSCRSYRRILEHVSYRDGLKYLSLIQPKSDAMDNLLSVISHGAVGGPATFFYSGLGEISPTILRYAKTHQDFLNLFGKMDGSDIVEIGCGFGGLAAQLINGQSVNSYSIVDLPEVELLIEKYLNVSEKKRAQIAKYSHKHELPENFDFLISNYAFSELQREVQVTYFERYIKHSSRGYMIYNHINPKSYNSFTAEEILQMIPGSEIRKEIPETDPTNVLIIWGHNLN